MRVRVGAGQHQVGGLRDRGGVVSGLRGDCSRCFGLCCVVLGFSRSADFPVDKPAGTACLNLAQDFRCSVHRELRPRGFVGCTVYDCFGAGQRVSQDVFGGVDWRSSPDVASVMFRVFPVVRQLHELLWYLEEARRIEAAVRFRAEVAGVHEKVEQLAGSAAEVLAGMDVGVVWGEVSELLGRVSRAARGKGRELQRADLAGKKLRGTDLRRANLRGAFLMGADLRGADLGLADLIGADLRGADLRGTNLATSLFLTQPQLAAAKGDDATRMPTSLHRPSHWGQ